MRGAGATLMLIGALFSCWNLARADDDLPPIGRSRFDLLVGNSPVPYPFDRLIGKLNSQLQLPAGGLSPLKITFIPLGRSLQRSAAAPDFFKFPRVVVAVDGNAKPGFAPLRDRLFLGYQEKTGILEVISYNEAAGRFEFQVVRDYRAGAKPQVRYARRALCLACHQNMAPIFARPLWDETSANPAIADLLRASRRDFYGLKLTGTDVAYLIAAAAERANLFPVWQRIWREGCGAGLRGAQCRRDWLDAALRYALSGAMPPLGQAQSFEYLQSRWARLWPTGLAIPNPDIPNRDPLMPVVEKMPQRRNDRFATLSQLAHIPAQFEPLNVRPPLETWTSVDPPRLAAGLASLLSGADVQALDRALLASSRPASVQRLTMPCRITRKPGRRIRFDCASARQRFVGAWTVQAAGRANGQVERLHLTGTNSAPDIALLGRSRSSANSLQADFSASRAGLSARLSDGRLVQGIHFSATGMQGQVTLRLRDDYAAVRTLLLGQRADDDTVFDPGTWMTALVSEFRPGARLRPVEALPPIRIDPPVTHPSSGSAAQFDRQCGQCHNTGERFPPNFLHGDAAVLDRQLDQCAERIYYRLSMWQVPEARRGKTPMPPLAVLATRGFNADGWAHSSQLAALVDEIRHRLRAQGEQPESVLTRPFEQLRSCLPATVVH